MQPNNSVPKVGLWKSCTLKTVRPDFSEVGHTAFDLTSHLSPILVLEADAGKVRTMIPFVQAHQNNWERRLNNHLHPAPSLKPFLSALCLTTRLPVSKHWVSWDCLTMIRWDVMGTARIHVLSCFHVKPSAVRSVPCNGRSNWGRNRDTSSHTSFPSKAKHGST